MLIESAKIFIVWMDVIQIAFNLACIHQGVLRSVNGVNVLASALPYYQVLIHALFLSFILCFHLQYILAIPVPTCRKR